MFDTKKTQILKIVVLIFLFAACLIGAGAYGFFYNIGSGISSTPLSSSPSNSEYSNAKNRVDTLSQQLKSSPNDISLQQDLGNAYYDLGSIAQKSAPNEAKAYFSQAINYYQAVLKSNQDLNILTDMATAAYYSDQFDLAEQSFQKALSINPNFAPALNNYGIFLYQVKKDNTSAIRMWETALNLDPNGANSELLKKLINQAKGR